MAQQRDRAVAGPGGRAARDRVAAGAGDTGLRSIRCTDPALVGMKAKAQFGENDDRAEVGRTGRAVAGEWDEWQWTVLLPQAIGKGTFRVRQSSGDQVGALIDLLK